MSTNDDQLRIVQLFTGGGKGKTSAAMGSTMRASGYSLKTCVIFFVNGRHWLSKYRSLAALANTDCFTFGESGLERPEDIGARETKWGRQALAAAVRAVTSGIYDLVVLDDINKAIAWNMIDVESVAQLIAQNPADVELILTGEGAPPRLISLADLVTKIEDGKKHPPEPVT
jgi:cob(I)alamin adenosyltransferase